MFTTTEAVPINVPTDSVRLTPDQVWRALQIRARNGDDRFVPPGHRFEVVKDEGDRLVRRVILESRDEELQRISFHGGRVCVFDFVEGPQCSVIICAIEADDAGEFWLRLTFLSEFRDIPHGSAEERALADKRRPLMRSQPALILSVARELVAEGRL